MRAAGAYQLNGTLFVPAIGSARFRGQRLLFSRRARGSPLLPFFFFIFSGFFFFPTSCLFAAYRYSIISLLLSPSLRVIRLLHFPRLFISSFFFFSRQIAMGSGFLLQPIARLPHKREARKQEGGVHCRAILPVPSIRRLFLFSASRQPPRVLAL